MLISLFSLFLSFAQAKTTVIAVLDTGLAYNERSADGHICKFGHRDFTEEQKFDSRFDTKDAVPVDVHGHGTNVAGIINYYASKTNKRFCLVILKIYSFRDHASQISFSIAAIRYALAIRADIINYSGGGYSLDKEEEKAVKEYIANGGLFVAAAGNENRNIDNIPYYPASYADTIVVGNLNSDFSRTKSSNYGKRVTRWEYGNNIKSFEFLFSGTSQAAAAASGKLVGESEINMIKAIKELHYRK